MGGPVFRNLPGPLTLTLGLFQTFLDGLVSVLSREPDRIPERTAAPPGDAPATCAPGEPPEVINYLDMDDRNLEESIFQLRKLTLDSSAGQLVEEAAQLCAAGRHLEARAVVEKVEAMVAVPAGGGTRTPVWPRDLSGGVELPERRTGEDAVARLVANLANGLAKLLVATFQELEQNITGESRKVKDSFYQELARLQAGVDKLVQLEEKIEHLTQTVSEQRSAGFAAQEKFEQLSAAVGSLRDADARQEAETGVLRNQTQQLAVMTSQRLESLSAQLGLQQNEISDLNSAVSQISSKVAGFSERLERQDDDIRSLNQIQSQRAAGLSELIEVLSRIKLTMGQSVAAAGGQG